MDKIVKVMLRSNDIDTLDSQAKAKGIPRMYLLREIIEGYLYPHAGPAQVPTQGPREDPGSVEVLNKALEDTQKERDMLRSQVNTLETSLRDKTQTLEYTRGQYQALQTTLNELVLRVPVPRPALEERTSWWDRHFGKKPETPTTPEQ